MLPRTVKSELMGTGDARMPVQTSQVSKQGLMRANAARTSGWGEWRWHSPPMAAR